MEHHSTTFIGGRWVDTHGDQVTTVIDPSTEKCIASVLECSSADADAAVQAARDARPVMQEMLPADRAAMLSALADSLEVETAQLADQITAEMGVPVKHSRALQVDPAIETLRSFARILAGMSLQEAMGTSLVVREPVGVVAAITPWNYPLLQTAAKVGGALAAGCPVVLKPSEISPLNALALAHAAARSGLPAGAVNLVLGTGPTVGEHLVQHPDVAMVSLTGSTRAGRRVASLAGRSVKRVAMELGGKSPAVVLHDGDLGAAVEHAVASVMLNTGQTCTALSRLLVPRDLLSDAAALVREQMGRYRVGSAHDPDSDVGPVASESQRQRVQDFQERARIEGAQVLWECQDDLPAEGFFVSPMAVSVTDPKATVAQQEIFGPVLTVMAFRDEQEAVAIANGTQYGLYGAVWSRNEERAMSMARALEAGSVDVNGAQFNDLAPFGGYRQSGYGRELGVHGILEFTQLKAIQT